MRSGLCETFAGIRRSQVGAVIYAAPIPRLHLLLFCCLKVVRASDLSPPKPAHLLFRIRPLVNHLERPPRSRGSAAAGNRKWSLQTRQTAVARRHPPCCPCLVQTGGGRGQIPARRFRNRLDLKLLTESSNRREARRHVQGKHGK